MQSGKLAFVITSSSLGGAQVHLLDLISYFSRSRSVFVIVGDEGWLTEQLQQMGVGFYVVPHLKNSLSITNLIRAIVSVLKILRLNKPVIVHSHSSFAGLIGRVCSAILRINSIFTVHGCAYTPGTTTKNRFLSLWIERVLSRSLRSKIIYVSNFDKELSEKMLVNVDSRSSVIHNGVLSPKFCVWHKRITQGCLKIVMVARFDNQKDHETAIQAALRLGNRVQLHFFGEGPLLDHYQSIYSSSANIIFHGRKSNVTDHLVNFDIFLLTSNYEGLPISILEALSVGLPIVASNVGGVCELIEDNVNGYLIPRHDVDYLCEKLKSFSSDKLSTFGQASHFKFQRSFEIKSMLCSVESIYSSCLSEV